MPKKPGKTNNATAARKPAKKSDADLFREIQAAALIKEFLPKRTPVGPAKKNKRGK